ncbi:hypothetical protein C5167_014546 [Papaver somniferum]|uniref:Uncharacterized protein n=1 Tax=Papaver somniferum TaxID=3469 RepID=A0A4Y7J3I1_PAPSO|nr:hypothetical protein C5167_014546 [Papaver somniferum]
MELALWKDMVKTTKLKELAHHDAEWYLPPEYFRHGKVSDKRMYMHLVCDGLVVAAVDWWWIGGGGGCDGGNGDGILVVVAIVVERWWWSGS